MLWYRFDADTSLAGSGSWDLSFLQSTYIVDIRGIGESWWCLAEERKRFRSDINI